MRKFFFDTSAYSLFARGDEYCIEFVREADELYFNPIVIGELLAGFDGGKYKEQNRNDLRKFLTFSSVILQPISEETSERYSYVYHDLRKKGRPIPTNDLWIAASVMETGSILITADRHFQYVDPIQKIILE